MIAIKSSWREAGHISRVDSKVSKKLLKSLARVSSAYLGGPWSMTEWIHSRISVRRLRLRPTGDLQTNSLLLCLPPCHLDVRNSEKWEYLFSTVHQSGRTNGRMGRHSCWPYLSSSAWCLQASYRHAALTGPPLVSYHLPASLDLIRFLFLFGLDDHDVSQNGLSLGWLAG